MDIIWRPENTLPSSLCFSNCIWSIAAIHWIRVAKHLQGPIIHSLLLIFDRIIFNRLNTFGRKVIVVYEWERISAENMKSAGLWVITMELFITQMLIQILQSSGQSKQNIQLSKQLWLALHYLNFVTRVTFVIRVTMFKTLWFGVKRPDMCYIVYILTTNLAAIVCVCAQNLTNFCPPLLFRIHTSRKFCSHSKIPIRCLWTAFCVPLSFIFYEKRWFRMKIVTLRRSRFAALWQINNSRNPLSRRGALPRGQRENVVGPT